MAEDKAITVTTQSALFELSQWRKERKARMMALFDMGYLIKDIALEYGISHQRVSQILGPTGRTKRNKNNG